MKAEILHIEECLNWRAAGEDLRAALDASGHGDVEIAFTLVRSADEAARVPFAGSPTILIDGVDLFPADVRAFELACRVYVTTAGLQGRPTQRQLERAIAHRLQSGDGDAKLWHGA